MLHIICIYIEKERFILNNSLFILTILSFKELAHEIVRAAKSEMCRVGQQAGDSVRVDVASLSLKSCRLENSFFFSETSVFILKAFN